MKPPHCKTCGADEFNHTCAGRQTDDWGSATGKSSRKIVPKPLPFSDEPEPAAARKEVIGHPENERSGHKARPGAAPAATGPAPIPKENILNTAVNSTKPASDDGVALNSTRPMLAEAVVREERAATRETFPADQGKPKRDRKEYQRELMRKRRADAKAKKEQEA